VEAFQRIEGGSRTVDDPASWAGSLREYQTSGEGAAPDAGRLAARIRINRNFVGMIERRRIRRRWL